MARRWQLQWIALLFGAAGCNGDGPPDLFGSGNSSGEETSHATAASTTADGGSGSEAGPGDDSGPKLDVGPDTGPGGGSLCKVGDEMDAMGPCGEQAPPDSFDPDIQWVWPGHGEDRQVVVTPLVANLTDDNGDGEIDLCDIPDVIVAAYPQFDTYPDAPGHLYALDGESGALHFVAATSVDATVNPAVGDIDGDGTVEIVAVEMVQSLTDGRLVAFEHDGTAKWISDVELPLQQKPIGLADLDADGDVEIYVGGYIFDHEGQHLWTGEHGPANPTTVADLDGDDDLEIIVGFAAYHHDGSVYFQVEPPAYGQSPHVADLDGDGLPEVMVVADGITIIEHDGTVTTAGGAAMLAESRPAAVHDIDGDNAPEIVVGRDDIYSALEADLGMIWSAGVHDPSCCATGTAFDFLGDGTAEAMYADQNNLFVFDANGGVLFSSPRLSWTQTENPVVADVDNDGSAEIVVVSNNGGWGGAQEQPPVQVLRDAQDRWVPARRIWNQHDYFVTNVREDGTIPQVQEKNWLTLNTFRTQAQIELGSGSVCQPVPEG